MYDRPKNDNDVIMCEMIGGYLNIKSEPYKQFKKRYL